jgi:hypothetical protein
VAASAQQLFEPGAVASGDPVLNLSNRDDAKVAEFIVRRLHDLDIRIALHEGGYIVTGWLLHLGDAIIHAA